MVTSSPFTVTPFSLVDLLFRTGLAGTFVSLPSIAITVAVLYKIIKEQMDASWIAFMGAGLYFLNPNILYLWLTAMIPFIFKSIFLQCCFLPRSENVILSNQKIVLLGSADPIRPLVQTSLLFQAICSNVLFLLRWLPFAGTRRGLFLFSSHCLQPYAS